MGNQFTAIIKRFSADNRAVDMETIRQFIADEDAVGVVEIILILVVLIGLVIIFKSQLTTLVNNIFNKITSQSSTI